MAVDDLNSDRTEAATLFNLRLGAVDDGAVGFSGPSRVSVQAQAEALSRQAV